MGISTTNLKINDIQAGKAGVHIVCADLILKGHIAFPSEEALPYDVVAEIAGKLVRIQVKTTRTPVPIPARKRKEENSPVYFFQIMRMGREGKKRYTNAHNDIFALVALDRKQIAYVNHEQVKTSMMFRLREYEGKYYGDKYMNDRAKIVALRKLDPQIPYTVIGKRLGLHDSYVSNLWRMKSVPQFKWRFLDDFTLENAIAGGLDNGDGHASIL